MIPVPNPLPILTPTMQSLLRDSVRTARTMLDVLLPGAQATSGKKVVELSERLLRNEVVDPLDIEITLIEADILWTHALRKDLCVMNDGSFRQYASLSEAERTLVAKGPGIVNPRAELAARLVAATLTSCIYRRESDVEAWDAIAEKFIEVNQAMKGHKPS